MRVATLAHHRARRNGGATRRRYPRSRYGTAFRRKMTEDELRRYRDCAHALAELADPFIKRRLLDLACRYEQRLHGKTVKPLTIANLPERQLPIASHS